MSNASIPPIRPRRLLVLGYLGLLAAVAGFVNSVLLLVMAFPVGNLTALATKLSMDSANPLLYDASMIAAIGLGFLAGAACCGAVFATEPARPGRRQSAILAGEAALLVATTGIEFPELKVMLAAAACGLQNAMTSAARGTTARTTHFTGTITDLGLMLGRRRRQQVDRWAAAVLVTTLTLFLAGGVAGEVVGVRLGDTALFIPAAACLVIAAAGLLYARRGRALPGPAPEPAEPAGAAVG